METAILNIVNYQILIATKAARIKHLCPNEVCMEFGTRRAHEFDAAIWGTRAAIIGGFDATSNVKAAKLFGIPCSGTHAHSFVQAYQDEETAFKKYASVHKDCYFLVDTYDTLRSGIPTAIKVADELKDKIGVVFDDLLVPEEMTLVDLEKFCSRVYSKWDREFFYQLKKKFKLSEKQAIQSYSRGMRMKLSMAVALSHKAEILILDEATSGLDPIVRDEILDFLLDFIQDENHTILISSHILSDLEKVADYIAFINDGKVLFVESKDELKENYAICTLSNEEVKNLDEEAIIGRRIHAFGQEMLVKRNFIPDGIRLQKPSIEDIMIYFLKGDKR